MTPFRYEPPSRSPGPRFARRIAGFWSDEDGATMVEYALMVTLISMSLIASVVLVTQALTGTLGTVDRGLAPSEMSDTEYQEYQQKRTPRSWGFR